MKQIKDYLHLHLGTECLFENKVWKLWRIGYEYADLKNNEGKHCRIHLHNVRLLLRPISNMTEAEAVKCDELSGGIFTDFYGRAKEIRYLLSLGFDLFGLIESGLAIDKTTLKEKI